MADTLTGLSWTLLNSAVASEPIGPYNLGFLLRKFPKDVFTLNNIYSCSKIISVGSFYDGTGLSRVGTQINTSQRLMDHDTMQTLGILDCKNNNIYFENVENAPVNVKVYSKGNLRDNTGTYTRKGTAKPVAVVRDGKSYISALIFKADMETKSNAKASESDDFCASQKLLHKLKDFEYTEDLVEALGCPGWPDVAANWIHRPRHWPPPKTVLQCMVGGYHLVPKPHSGGDPETEWRYSFSLAEAMLMDALTDTQWKCFYICKTLLHTCLNVADGFSTYHIKTLLMWTCENRPPEYWLPDNLTSAVVGIVDGLIHAYAEGFIPHYFIDNYNILEETKQPTVRDTLRQLKKLRENFIPKLQEAMRLNRQITERHFLFYQRYRLSSFLSNQIIAGQDLADHLKVILDSMIPLYYAIKETEGIALSLMPPQKPIYDALLILANMSFIIGRHIFQTTLQKLELLHQEDSPCLDQASTSQTAYSTTELTRRYVENLEKDIDSLFLRLNGLRHHFVHANCLHNFEDMWASLRESLTSENSNVEKISKIYSFVDLSSVLPHLIDITDFDISPKLVKTKSTYLLELIDIFHNRPDEETSAHRLAYLPEDVTDFILKKLKKFDIVALYKNINIIMASCTHHEGMQEHFTLLDCDEFCCRDWTRGSKDHKWESKPFSTFLIEVLGALQVLVLIGIIRIEKDILENAVPEFVALHTCSSTQCVFGIMKNKKFVVIEF